MEIWKACDELPGYSVSNLGNVRKDSTGEIVKPRYSCGYARVSITKNVHRLVAKAFLEEPEDEDKCWVDHIDENRANNDSENLRWVTPSENALAYGYEARREAKKRPIKATHLDGREIVFESRQAAAEYFECSDSEIHYGRVFKRGNKKGWLLEKLKI